MKVFKTILSLYQIREFLWNYPVNLLKIYKKSKPLSNILVYSLVGVYIFQLFAYPTLYSFSFGAFDKGETFTEGILGSISSYNPLILSGSDIDRGLYNLIYTKLIELDADGSPLPALATSWEESNSGKTIRFIISDNYYWHDGEKVTAEDVVYTFTRAVELGEVGIDTFGPTFTGVEITSDADNTVVFNFEEKVAAVYESLSVYIVPEHLFGTLDPSNTMNYGTLSLPIGSGLYRVNRRTTEVLELTAWEMHENTPSVQNFRYLFFPTIESLEIAFKNNLLDAIGNVNLENFELLEDYDMYHAAKVAVDNRKKILYMNLRDEQFQSIELRQGIAYAIDKQRLVDELPQAQNAVSSTLSSNSWAFSPEVEEYYAHNLEDANASLSAAGYELPEGEEYRTNSSGETLVLDIVYLDTFANNELVDLLEEMLNAAGIRINRKGVGFETLVNEILATHKFDLLISELEVTSDPDQYNLWHSTKINYPDLNISGYEYNRVDILLEGARVENDKAVRKDDYLQIQTFIAQDVPAITLFEPSYTYIVNEKFTNLNIEDANFPYDRYWNIENWQIVN